MSIYPVKTKLHILNRKPIIKWIKILTKPYSVVIVRFWWKYCTFSTHKYPICDVINYSGSAKVHWFFQTGFLEISETSSVLFFVISLLYIMQINWYALTLLYYSYLFCYICGLTGFGVYNFLKFRTTRIWILLCKQNRNNKTLKVTLKWL